MTRMARFISSLLAALALFVVADLLAAPADDVLRAERERVAALVADDFAALDRLLSPALNYGHSSGVAETKAEYLDALRSGRLKYKSLEHSSPSVRIHGDTAIMQGTSKVRAVSGGVESTVNLRFLLVYIRDGGQWRLAAWQSTRLP